MSKLYYTIGEVSKMLNLTASTLRYYETRFAELRPSKNSRGVRRYTEADIELLRRIKTLVDRGGYTLDGVRHQLGSTTDAPLAPQPEPAATQASAPAPDGRTQAAINTLRQVRAELQQLSDSLD